MESLNTYEKINQLPPALQSEVVDFIDFLLHKTKSKTIDPKPRFGSAKGMISIMEGFDEPLDDFKDYSE